MHFSLNLDKGISLQLNPIVLRRHCITSIFFSSIECFISAFHHIVLAVSIMEGTYAKRTSNTANRKEVELLQLFLEFYLQAVLHH